MEKGFSALYKFDLGNYDFVNPGSNILSVTGTAPGDFNKKNVTTDAVREVWRSVDSLDWQEIIIKADTKSTVDTFGILNHNFSESAVVQVQANVSNNFLAPPVTITIPYSKLNMVHCGSFGGSYEYYRVRVLDPSNPCGYIQIGRIVGGRAVIMVSAEDINDDFEIGYADKAKQMETEGFFRAYNEMVKIRSISAKFSKLSTVAGQNANFTNLRKFFDYVGITRPFLAVVDRGNPSFCSLWGQLNDIPSESYTINQYVSQSVKITEVF